MSAFVKTANRIMLLLAIIACIAFRIAYSYNVIKSEQLVEEISNDLVTDVRVSHNPTQHRVVSVNVVMAWQVDDGIKHYSFSQSEFERLQQFARLTPSATVEEIMEIGQNTSKENLMSMIDIQLASL